MLSSDMGKSIFPAEECRSTHKACTGLPNKDEPSFVLPKKGRIRPPLSRWIGVKLLSFTAEDIELGSPTFVMLRG